MGVVEIEGVGQDAVDEGGGGGRQSFAEADHRRFRGTTPGRRHLAGHGAGGQRSGGETEADHVEDPVADALGHLRRQAPGLDPGGEGGKALERRPAHGATATGRTGTPVAPGTLRGVRTKRNSQTLCLASSDRFISSRM